MLIATATSARTRTTTEALAPESVLVLGAGSAGYRHITNALTLGVPQVAVYRTLEGVPRSSLPEPVRVETNLDHALGRNVQAVVVANPTAFHLRTALKAVQAGCHVLVEKPLSHSLEGVHELHKQAAFHRTVVLIGYQFRYHPGLRQVRQWIRAGAIGRAVSAHVRWGEYLPNWQPWRDYRTSYSGRAELGGGVLLTLSHPIDYLRWLLGDVVRVSALTSRQGGLGLDVEDTALVHLTFGNGAIASLALDYVQRPPEHSLLVVGQEGLIRWDGIGGSASLEAASDSAVREPLRWTPERFERNDLFLAELRHFFRCISGEEQPTCTLADGEAALRICLAGLESSRTGRSVDV